MEIKCKNNTYTYISKFNDLFNCFFLHHIYFLILFTNCIQAANRKLSVEFRAFL